LKLPIISIAAATVILIVIAYCTGGLPLVLEGIDNAWETAMDTMLFLVAAFIIIGQLRQLLTTELVNNWIQKFSGVKGILICALCGGFLPGNPFVVYSFLGSMFKKGIPFHILLSIIAGKRIYNYTRFPIEIALIGPQVAILRYLITLPAPLLMGLLSYRLFPNKIVTSLLEKEGESDARTTANF